jgi:hypothetical protein
MHGSGLLIYGLGGISTIAAPVLVSATDNADQDSVDVVVTGIAGATIRLFYRVLGATSWTTGNTRTGSGTITQTGLSASTWYEMYVDQFIGNTFSPLSAIVTVFVAAAAGSNIESALVAKVTGDVTVSSIIAARMYPQIVPQGVSLPAVTYSEISGLRKHDLNGPCGLVESRWQLNCWTTTRSGARTLADAVRQSIDGFDGFVGAVEIQSIQMANEVDLGDFPAGVDVSRKYGTALDFEIWFKETT